MYKGTLSAPTFFGLIFLILIRGNGINWFVSFIGGETMIKTEKTDIDVGLVHAQREYLSIGQELLLLHDQDHAPKGW